MKRSEINKALKELEAMCAKYKCYLPPFCNFTPEEWQEKGHEYDLFPYSSWLNSLNNPCWL